MSDVPAVSAAIRRWMARVTFRSMQGWSRYVKEQGLSMAQAGVLIRLRHHGGCGVSEIAEDFGISAAAASQLLDRLVNGGLVDRSENPADRRARILTISDRGRELVDRGMAERYRWVDDLAARLSPAERELVGAALPVLTEAEGRLPEGDIHAHPSSEQSPNASADHSSRSPVC